jgi:peroxiredoxin
LIVLSAGLPERSRANAIFTIHETPVAAEVGALAPPVNGTDINGKPVSLASLKGEVVILNFWATWCAPCVEETPALQAAYEAHRRDGLRVIGVDSAETPADVLAWTARFNVTYTLLIERHQEFSQLYRIRGLPTTFIIGRDGFIKQIYYGPVRNIDAAISDPLR